MKKATDPGRPGAFAGKSEIMGGRRRLSTERERAGPANWGHWERMPKAELWRVVALSFGVEPGDWVDVFPNGLKYDDAEEVFPLGYWERLSHARAHFGKGLPVSGALPTDSDADVRGIVRLSDFRCWAEELPIPLMLPTGFPHGLQHLAAAVPHFITSARPVAVPPALLALAPDDIISFRHNFKPNLECTAYAVGDYRADIECRIARQAEGFFTLNEAAQILAESRPGLKPVDAVKRFCLAHSKGLLPIHQADTRFSLEAGEAVSKWSDLLELSELDTWLRKSTGYGFPGASGHDKATARLTELVPDRNSRWLAISDTEERGQKRGAQSRAVRLIVASEPFKEATVKRGIQNARKERIDRLRLGPPKAARHSAANPFGDTGRKGSA